MYSSFKKQQLLTESWRQFLLEVDNEEVIKHNIEFFKKNIENYVLGTDLEYSFLDVSAKEAVKKIKPLTKNKITKFIGSGAFGVVFGLDNGHVLKLYVSGVEDSNAGNFNPETSGKAEEEFYKKSMDDLFSGKATRETLPVYDMGTARMFDKFKDEKIVRYVEMAKLETRSNFSQEIQYALIETLDDIRFDVADMTSNFDDLENFNFQDFENINKPKFVKALRYGGSKYGGSIEKVAKQIADNFFSSLKQLLDEYGPKAIQDIHIGNVGIDPTSPRDNPKFIFFDPALEIEKEIHSENKLTINELRKIIMEEIEMVLESDDSPQPLTLIDYVVGLDPKGSSKAMARRLIQNRGVKIDGEVITNPEIDVSKIDKDKIQVGKSKK